MQESNSKGFSRRLVYIGYSKKEHRLTSEISPILMVRVMFSEDGASEEVHLAAGIAENAT